jgi:hypothetical protein
VGPTISPIVNYALLHEWFLFCLQNHSTCAIQPPETPRCLKLINCNTGSLVYAPQRARYAALSYVWGDKKRPQSTQTLGTTQVPDYSDLDLPPILPRTIKDAMDVTRNLGIQYLWVDKYCINQGDELEKQKQIAVMGDIYADAEVTIISAYGEDDEAGLPGVNNLSRNTQHYAKIGNICLVSTLPRPIISIKSARWNTRGWTLQEAILSRRRLVFTADQVYFECRAMWCYESLDFPLSDFYTKNKTRRQFRHFLTPGIFSGNSTFSAIAKSPECTISQLREYIRDYSWRDLTEDSDSLNAFVGILERFKNAIPPIGHHLGVPFQHSDLTRKNATFLSSLAWDTTTDTSTPRRRPLFPSWSWLGWKGAISFPDIIPSKLQPDFSINTASRILELYAFTLDPGAIIEGKSPMKLIHLDYIKNHSRTNPCCVKMILFGVRTFINTAQPLDDGSTFLAKLRSGVWECVYFGQSPAGWFFFLIIEWRGTTSGRVGCLMIEDNGQVKPVLINKRKKFLIE